MHVCITFNFSHYDLNYLRTKAAPIKERKYFKHSAERLTMANDVLMTDGNDAVERN